MDGSKLQVPADAPAQAPAQARKPWLKPAIEDADIGALTSGGGTSGVEGTSFLKAGS